MAESNGQHSSALKIKLLLSQPPISLVARVSHYIYIFLLFSLKSIQFIFLGCLMWWLFCQNYNYRKKKLTISD